MPRTTQSFEMSSNRDRHRGQIWTRGKRNFPRIHMGHAVRRTPFAYAKRRRFPGCLHTQTALLHLAQTRNVEGNAHGAWPTPLAYARRRVFSGCLHTQSALRHRLGMCNNKQKHYSIKVTVDHLPYAGEKDGTRATLPAVPGRDRHCTRGADWNLATSTRHMYTLFVSVAYYTRLYMQCTLVPVRNCVHG